MSAPVDLRSDNAAGACPDVLAAIAEANSGTALGYGGDNWTDRLRRLVREVFEHPEAEVFPVVSGTAANALSLSALCPPWGSVLCHETAHIAVHECGATSHLSGGAVLRTLPGAGAQIEPQAVRDVFTSTWWGDPHHSQPSVLSITCPSDLGTVPAPDKVRKLADLARERGLRVHMDGARLANALAALGCAPADLTWRAGVDLLSLGMTKNGGLSADAIVAFDPACADSLRYRLKRSGHTPSKMRFQSAQLIAMLEDRLWLRLAGHANDRSRELSTGLGDLGVAFDVPPQVNLMFPRLDVETVATLAGSGEVLFYELEPGVVRFVTSWQTTKAEIDRAVTAVHAALR